MFTEQLFNDKLLVDTVRIGVSTGVKVNSLNEDKRTLVSGDEVKKAVNELMGKTEEANERKKRVKEVVEMVKKAMGEGGSYNIDMSRLILELMDVKAVGETERKGIAELVR